MPTTTTQEQPPFRCQGKPLTYHPACLAVWWCRYLLPEKGVLVDPFCGSGTMLVAVLDCGASQVIGIDKEKKYLQIAHKMVANE